jgi:hypothetical protein
MVTLADGLGQVVAAAPQPVREIAQQVINKVTGDGSGDALLNLANGSGNGAATSVTDLALLVPEILRLTEKTLDINKLKGQSVGEVMAMLHRQVKAEDRPAVEKAQHALAMLPILNDLPFDELYLRATAK